MTTVSRTGIFRRTVFLAGIAAAFGTIVSALVQTGVKFCIRELIWNRGKRRCCSLIFNFEQ